MTFILSSSDNLLAKDIVKLSIPLFNWNKKGDIITIFLI